VQGQTQKLTVKCELKTGLIQTNSIKIHVKTVIRAQQTHNITQASRSKLPISI